MSTDSAPPSAPHDHDALRSALLDRLERLSRPLGAWERLGPSRVALSLHRYPVTVSIEPLPSPDGEPVLGVTSAVSLAQDLPAERYLPLLARHARRADALGRLARTAEGDLVSTRDQCLVQDPDGTGSVEEVVEAIAVQTLEAEFLAVEVRMDGLLEADHDPPGLPPPPVRERPDGLMAVAYHLARDGVRQMATVGLTGESKLGPWFVGTQQDALLQERLAAGWTRTADPTRHRVRLDAPDAEEVLGSIEVRWAHVSPLLGPCVLLAATRRAPLGERPSQRLQDLNRVGGLARDRGRVGVWLPEGWLDEATLGAAANGVWRPGDDLAAGIAADRAAWVTVAPTAWARPGALARLWRWAEHEVQRSFRPGSLN